MSVREENKKKQIKLRPVEWEWARCGRKRPSTLSLEKKWSTEVQKYGNTEVQKYRSTEKSPLRRSIEQSVKQIVL